MSSTGVKVVLAAGALAGILAGGVMIYAERPMPCADVEPLDRDTPFLIAYRGAPDHLPTHTWQGFSMSGVFENTIPALKRSKMRGFHTLDGALRRSADDTLLLFEDEEVLRMTDGEGRVQDLDWAQLEGLTVASEGKIPSVKAVLASFRAGDTRFHWRIPGGPEGYAIARSLGALLSAEGRVDDIWVASDDREVLDEIRRSAPKITPILSMKKAPTEAEWRGFKPDAFGCALAFEMPQAEINADVIAQANAHGMALIAEGVDDGKIWQRMQDLGVMAGLTSFTAFAEFDRNAEPPTAEIEMQGH